MADAADLGSAALSVRVQVSYPAPLPQFSWFLWHVLSELPRIGPLGICSSGGMAVESLLEYHPPLVGTDIFYHSIAGTAMPAMCPAGGMAYAAVSNTVFYGFDSHAGYHKSGSIVFPLILIDNAGGRYEKTSIDKNSLCNYSN